MIGSDATFLALPSHRNRPWVTWIMLFVVIASAVALYRQLPLKAMRIPVYASFSKEDCLYLQIYFKAHNMPSLISLIRVDPEHQTGISVGKRFVFPGGWRVEVQEVPRKDGTPRNFNIPLSQ
jgi:hypothetical protein